MSLLEVPRPPELILGPDARLLCGFALPVADALLAALAEVTATAPFRYVLTPGGQRMSAALTSCGTWGWHGDGSGYRYVRHHPQTGQPWPVMPTVFAELAARAAAAAGFGPFVPDACLINRYLPGGKMGLHQDRDERDLTQPIVSVSLGLPTAFVFGGPSRTSPVRKFVVEHGDVAVWGGQSRLYFHGVLPVPAGDHPAVGSMRINLTFRKSQ